MKHIWINSVGLYEYTELQLAEMGFETTQSFGAYLESTYGLTKENVLRGPDVDIIFFGKAGRTILLVMDQDGSDCLRAKDKGSNELLKIIANNLEGRYCQRRTT